MIIFDASFDDTGQTRNQVFENLQERINVKDPESAFLTVTSLEGRVQS